MKTGFFISCRKGKEERAFKEFITSANTIFQNKKYDIDYSTLNVSEEINKDIKIFKKSVFSIFFTYKSILYISNVSEYSSIDIFKFLRSQNSEFEYIQRIVPIEKVYHYKDNFSECCKYLNNTSFKIIYEERFAPPTMKNLVFDSIIKVMDMKVDLKDPTHKVLVQVLKTSVGISVLSDFNESFNFSKQ